MIYDHLLQFCEADSVAAAAGSSIVGDVVDTAHIGALRDLGNGKQLWLVIQVTTEIITGGVAGTIVFSLLSDSTANLATSPTTHLVSATFVTDDANANDDELNVGGRPMMVALPMGATYERYIGIQVTIGTTTVTAGAIDAFLTVDPPSFTAYPQGSVE